MMSNKHNKSNKTQSQSQSQSQYIQSKDYKIGEQVITPSGNVAEIVATTYYDSYKSHFNPNGLVYVVWFLNDKDKGKNRTYMYSPQELIRVEKKNEKIYIPNGTSIYIGLDPFKVINFYPNLANTSLATYFDLINMLTGERLLLHPIDRNTTISNLSNQLRAQVDTVLGENRIIELHLRHPISGYIKKIEL